MKPSKKKDLAFVARAPNEPIAQMWAGILENEGIHSVIKCQELTAAMYISSSASPCDIFVLPEQSETAKEILLPFVEDSEKTESEDQEPD
jgi:hypothetical protein